jgi:AcrR family transcriptional regulator
MKSSKAADTPVAKAAAKKPRGRPRSFDRAQALAAAIEVFWAKGYEATSISDLTAAMGINPPSLYSAFGDKEHLFLEAVESYQKARGDSCQYCDEPTARIAIERLLTYMATDLTDSCHPRGCLMAMASATASSSSAELQAALAERRVASRDRLKARIKRGIAEGDVPVGTDAGALADFYSTVMSGMAHLARDGATRKNLLATVEAAMRAWPADAALAGRKKRAMRSAETA